MGKTVEQLKLSPKPCPRCHNHTVWVGYKNKPYLGKCGTCGALVST